MAVKLSSVSYSGKLSWENYLVAALLPAKDFSLGGLASSPGSFITCNTEKLETCLGNMPGEEARMHIKVAVL